MISEVLSKRKERFERLKRIRKQGENQGLISCPECKKESDKAEIKAIGKVCPHCGYHFPMTPAERIRFLEDEKSFREMDSELVSADPLLFEGYGKKLQELRDKTKHKEAVVCGIMKMEELPVAIAVMDSRFMMGSMGTVVGEKIARLAEYAGRKKYPLLIFSASGGARMQEGLFSLMQMAKTSAAIEQFKENGGFYLSVMTNPTTGGVSASFANLGDIILAEPGALICFAGPRVIEQTIGEKLPEGFQRAEFLEEHGMVDAVVKRGDMKKILTTLLKMHSDIGKKLQ